jgi:hypothetical protein
MASLFLPVLVQSKVLAPEPHDAQLTLVEKTDMEAPLLRAFRNSYEEHLRTFASRTYMPYLLSEAQHEALTVRYHPRRGSRLYATLPAAQLMSSLNRLFLFGRNHSEIDLVAAALQIFILPLVAASSFKVAPQRNGERLSIFCSLQMQLCSRLSG